MGSICPQHSGNLEPGRYLLLPDDMRSLISFLRRLSLRWFHHSVQVGLVPVAAIVLSLLLLNPGDRAPESTFPGPVRIDSAQIDSAQIETRLDTAPALSQPHTTRLRRPESEIRGVWITNVASSVMFSPWGISRAIGQLSDMQFNTVYPVVWNRGKTFYRSDVLKQMTGHAIAPLMALMHPTEDPLSEMARVGHQKQMRVIPWFEYGFMVPLHSRLARQHPDWLTSRLNGTRRLDESALTTGEEATSGFVSRLLSSGAPNALGWLNPLHPEVQRLIGDLVEEVVNRYDVDGIQLDDHFSLPVEFGYDEYTVRLYQAEHEGRKPPNDEADEAWIQWRADKLTEFVGVLHSRVKAACPTCIFSVSPNPAKFAYRFHLQDWRTWLENDWLDELVVQVYRDELDRFNGELAKNTLQGAMDKIPVSIGILTGTWRRPISFEQIKAQVISSRDHHFSGVSFFYWDTLWSYFTPESPQKRRQNFRQLLSEELV
ncbi:MAG: family 10 glycosylhydrolase [Cyanobacteria bacterium J06648_10]